SLERAGLGAGRPIVLPPGEEAKSADMVARLWDAMREREVTRRDVLVAMGGGATLDTAGFAAATYARGIPLVNMPTTLLAMVDAGLGGKVGVDHGGVKNLVGAFHHPAAVVADIDTLTTLPGRHVRAGLAECVKASVAACRASLDVMEGLTLADDGIPARLGWVTEQAVRVKAAYVRDDPYDRGIRHALNLGHTFAHAIESATAYGVLHGEAVAMGLVAAARLGASLGVTEPELPGRIESVLSRLGLPLTPPDELDPARMGDAFRADKKRRGAGLTFVLPVPGGVDLFTGLDADRALAALRAHEAVAP
ncbi:MAG: 3-dehydroquinate synthase family protein, partial [Actinomycetota bacterium]